MKFKKCWSTEKNKEIKWERNRKEPKILSTFLAHTPHNKNTCLYTYTHTCINTYSLCHSHPHTPTHTLILSAHSLTHTLSLSLSHLLTKLPVPIQLASVLKLQLDIMWLSRPHFLHNINVVFIYIIIIVIISMIVIIIIIIIIIINILKVSIM